MGNARRLQFSVWTAILLGGPLLPFLIDPEPTLNRLYALTGTKPGPRDALSIKVIFWGGLLIWLTSLLRTMAQNTAKKPLQKRHQQASEIKAEAEKAATNNAGRAKSESATTNDHADGSGARA